MWHFPRRIQAMLLAFWLFSPLTSSAIAVELKTTLDAATGVKIAIPVGVVGEPKTEQWGQNWTSASRHLSIDTINLGKESLKDRFDRVVNRPGRVVSKKYFDDQRFVVEGTDKPKDHSKGGEALFHVEMYARG